MCMNIKCKSVFVDVFRVAEMCLSSVDDILGLNCVQRVLICEVESVICFRQTEINVQSFMLHRLFSFLVLKFFAFFGDLLF